MKKLLLRVIVLAAVISSFVVWQIWRAREAKMSFAVSSAFSFALEKKLVTVKNNQVIKFRLPLSDANFRDSQLSYLRYLPNGEYLMVGYRRNDRQAFSVLKIDGEGVKLISNGYFYDK
ncbi:MAG: hypothetical protein ACK53G_05020 [Armatimonadota bacterium]|jgi:hypothetical protein|nr:hypothetical protein [Fimbriimonadales bacterium]